MELTLGPVLFDWPRDVFLRFYEQAASMDVDRVYIGEVVCSRKLGFAQSDLKAIIRLLEGAGKKVTLSSLAVISNEDELEFTRRLLDYGCSIEANDMAVFNMADPRAREVFAGPHITAYNAPTIEFLKSVGVNRVTFPVEMSRDSFEYCLKETGVFGEVFAHGKVPLAFSWRCYTSRAYGLSKTDCKHDCLKYPDGMDLRTVDGKSIFSVNGTSILSADTYTLIEYVDSLREAGAGALRISPQHENTGKIVEVFRARMSGSIDNREALAGLKAVTDGGFSNGWYLGGAGKDYIERELQGR